MTQGDVEPMTRIRGVQSIKTEVPMQKFKLVDLVLVLYNVMEIGSFRRAENFLNGVLLRSSF